LIEVFKNTPPKNKFSLRKRYGNVSFQQKYSIKIIEDFFKRFPEERQGRKNFKKKEIQNFKLLIYSKILEKGKKIKADCIGCIKEKTSAENIIITVSFFKKNGK
jgi:protein involved in sex pheromone biosynthesis